MRRYACHLDSAQPHLDDPDYPPGCVAAPADYRRLGYLDWHATADARMKRGDRQVLCRTCDRWRWSTTPCAEPVQERR